MGLPSSHFQSYSAIQWTRGGASVAKYVRGNQEITEITPLLEDTVGGLPLSQWSGSGAVECFRLHLSVDVQY